MRALTSAILFFTINLIGMGFGPTSVGMLSDLLDRLRRRCAIGLRHDGGRGDRGGLGLCPLCSSHAYRA
jgi:hypothetical protein